MKTNQPVRRAACLILALTLLALGTSCSRVGIKPSTFLLDFKMSEGGGGSASRTAVGTSANTYVATQATFSCSGGVSVALASSDGTSPISVSVPTEAGATCVVSVDAFTRNGVSYLPLSGTCALGAVGSACPFGDDNADPNLLVVTQQQLPSSLSAGTTYTVAFTVVPATLNLPTPPSGVTLSGIQISIQDSTATYTPTVSLVGVWFDTILGLIWLAFETDGSSQASAAQFTVSGWSDGQLETTFCTGAAVSATAPCSDVAWSGHTSPTFSGPDFTPPNATGTLKLVPVANPGEFIGELVVDINEGASNPTSEYDSRPPGPVSLSLASVSCTQTTSCTAPAFSKSCTATGANAVCDYTYDSTGIPNGVQCSEDNGTSWLTLLCPPAK